MEQKNSATLTGVFKNGYGIIPKLVLHDPDLSLESKAIYAYLCAQAGDKHRAFPYRETILRDLGISKNTYYRHYTLLIEQGYITVRRPADKTAANIYLLIQNPAKWTSLYPKGLRSQGYGFIPRAVMVDKHLSVKAKGLYAYFRAYCGKGDRACPKKDHILYHLGISEPTYYKALRQLKEAGLLTAVQRTTDARFASNVYHLHHHPGATKSPDLSFPIFRDTISGDAANRDSLSNNKIINNSSSTNSLSPANPDKTRRQTKKDRQKKNAVVEELQKRTERLPLESKMIVACAVEVVKDILETRKAWLFGNQATAALWVKNLTRDPDSVDKLWAQITAFSASFSAKQKRTIRNPKAYCKAAFCNWMAEIPLRQSPEKEATSCRLVTGWPQPAQRIQRQRSSYDLAELERFIDAGFG